MSSFDSSVTRRDWFDAGTFVWFTFAKGGKYGTELRNSMPFWEIVEAGKIAAADNETALVRVDISVDISDNQISEKE